MGNATWARSRPESALGHWGDRRARALRQQRNLGVDSDEVVWLRHQASSATVVVTGGTEGGGVHYQRARSHAAGWKVDIRRNPQLDGYIHANCD